MKITIFGANGRVGRLLVDGALSRGHEVVAFTHNKNSLGNKPKLTIIKGDIYDAESVKNALKGSNLVISSLGSWGTPKKDILSEGMKNIIPGMHANKINRIISLTGAAAKMKGDKSGLADKLSRLSLNIIGHKILIDGEIHNMLLAQSDLDWTILRSPVMNESGDKNKFKLVNKTPLPWDMINRESVVLAMLDLITETKYSKQAPYIVKT